MSKKHFITIQNRWASLSSYSGSGKILFWHNHVLSLPSKRKWTQGSLNHTKIGTDKDVLQVVKQQMTTQYVFSHCVVRSWNDRMMCLWRQFDDQRMTARGTVMFLPSLAISWSVDQLSLAIILRSANDGKRHSHVLAEPGNQLVANIKACIWCIYSRWAKSIL